MVGNAVRTGGLDMSKMGCKINAAQLLFEEHFWTRKEIADALSVTPDQVGEWEGNDFATGP
jgi:phage portal protein BeeE